jgi:hypothetical protein
MKKQRTLIFFIQMSPFKKKKEMGNKAQFSAWSVCFVAVIVLEHENGLIA